MSTVNTQCQVTNNSGQAIVVLDAYTSTTNTVQNSAQTGYLQTLKNLTPTPIANNTSGTINLDDTYTNSKGQTETSYIYQLLISSPVGLFPVMNVGESLTFSSQSYPPITVTQAAANNMTLAFTFCQNIMAYPGSNLATGFVTAVNSAQQAGSVTAMMQAIANYFNTTKQFGGLDFPSYLAVSTYIKAFAWVWGLSATGTPNRTYWLYASSDANNSSATGQGSITFTQNASAPNPADPTDPNSGYTITYTPTSGSPVTLSFSNGALVNNTSVDVPSICLQGNFALKSTYTQNSSDNVLWPTFVGMLNGTQVIGVSQEPADATTSWLKSLLPTSFSDLFNDFMKIMGLWMAIDFLKTKLEGKKNSLNEDQANENDGEAPNQQQQQQADEDADQVEQNAQNANQQDANRLGNDNQGQPQVDVPDANNIPQAQQDVNADQVQVQNEIAGDNMQGAINEASNQVDALAEIGVNQQLEDAENSLLEANQNLPEAVSSGDFSNVSSNLSDASGSINEALQNMDVPQSVQDQVKESQAAQTEFEETSEQAQDNAKNTEEGEDEFDGEGFGE